jgi:hypothetical protein
MTEQLASAKAASSAELANVKGAVEREKARADAAARNLIAAADQVAAARARASKEAADAKAARDQEKARADAMERDIARVVEQLSATKATAAALDRERERADAAQRELETVQQQIAARQRVAGDVARAEQPGSIGRSAQAPVEQFAALSAEAARTPNATIAPSGDAGEQTLASLPPGPGRRLIERAAALINDRDISAARLLLERAAQSGNRVALFMLAQTYDAKMLSEWQVVGVAGDQARAAEFYRRASGAVSAASR